MLHYKECLSYYDNVLVGYCKKPFTTVSKSDKKVLKGIFDKYLLTFDRSISQTIKESKL